MGNELILKPYDDALRPMMNIFEEVLQPIGLPAVRLVRTALIAIEQSEKLRQCTMQSIVNATMSAAVLGLELDGVSGQGFFLPFAQKVQFCIGYKGFPTIAARSAWTMRSAVVREADVFEYDMGTQNYIRHKPSLDKPGTRIIAAYAIASPPSGQQVIVVLPYSEIVQTMERSPAVKAGVQTPWKDPVIGFPAMAAKTALRRVAKFVPVVGVQRAASFDQAHEESGRLVNLRPDGAMIDVTPEPAAAGAPADGSPVRPKFDILMGDRTTRGYPDINMWLDAWLGERGIIKGLSDKAPHHLKKYREDNGPLMGSLATAGFKDDVMRVQAAIAKALGEKEWEQGDRT